MSAPLNPPLAPRVANKTAAAVHSPRRADLQGLRALAVLAVLGYHLWPDSFGLGYLGVDIFFVLSGYLITGLLVRDLNLGGKLWPLLLGFWARRAKRLLPAALATIIATALAGLLLAPKSWWLESVGAGVAAAAYYENWYLGFQAVDYLRAEGLGVGASPFQQFWSLAVEEQFYLFWPLLLILAAKRRLWFVLAATALSGGYAVYMSFTAEAFGFFSTFTRIWQFGVGALLVLWRPGGRSHRIFDGAWFKPAVWLGDVSYSLYLWHWPVIILAPWVFQRAVIGSDEIWWDEYLLLAIAVALAVLSKHLIEDPIRYRKSALGAGRQLVIGLGASLTVIALLLVGQFAVRQAVSASWAESVMTPALSQMAEDRPIVEDQEFIITRDAPGFKVAEFGSTESPSARIALVGDSHARQYFGVLESLAKQNNWALSVISKSACTVQDPANFGLADIEGAGEGCLQWNRDLEKHLASKKYDLIVNSNSTLVHHGNLDVAASFASAAAGWVSIGSAVVVIADNPKPWAGESVTDFRVCIETAQAAAQVDCAISIERALQTSSQIAGPRPIGAGDALALAVTLLPGVLVLDQTSAYCPELKVCPPVIDGVAVYRDNSHITETFAATLRPMIESATLEALAGGK